MTSKPRGLLISWFDLPLHQVKSLWSQAADKVPGQSSSLECQTACKRFQEMECALQVDKVRLQFDRLLGVLILKLHGAEIAQGQVQAVVSCRPRR